MERLAGESDRGLICRLISDMIRPSEKMGIAEWAERYISLPPNVAEPGAYSLSRTPYLREPMNCLSPWSHVNEVVLRTGAQVGKTTVMQMAQMFYIAAAPCPQIFVFSTEGESRKFVTQKLNPMIRANPVVSSRIKGTMRNSSGDTMNMKEYAGGFLSIASGESAKTLRSLSVKIVMMDELDAMPDDLDGEGDPVDLARKRASSYGDSYKAVLSSTPVNGESKIIREYDMTDQRKYFVKCPNCHEYITLEWDMMRWEATDTLVKKVWMECPHCRKEIKNEDKLWMLQPENGAEWRPTNDKATSPNRRGYFLNALYSPVGWFSWKQAVEQYLKAQKLGGTSMTTFYNTVLAEQYTLASEAPDWQRLKARGDSSGRERDKVPKEVMVITTGSDVQQDRIETTVVGWGRNGRAWVIDHRSFFLAPGQSMDNLDNDAWLMYKENVLDNWWEREDGVILNPIANGLDRSFLPDTVSAFYIRIANPNLYPIRGVDNMTGLTALRRKDLNNPGAFFWNTPVSDLKHFVYASFRTEDNTDHTEPKFVSFPNDMGQEYYEQITAEQYMPPDKKHKSGQWIKARRRNEALDCFVYNQAVHYILGLNTFTNRDWDELEGDLIAARDAMIRGKATVKGRGRRRVVSKGIL